ncbi:Uncharacterized protein BC141101_05738 [Bacillus toyonensis]|uniref:hypothetical protein n=1 Tax=Bacillus toyonensis TaxID=155322 RepID=UPI00027BE8FC|nr:hypothetical protein [Bacillus toyonensis]EJV41942.1 hypothetical protein IEA_05441 [Bacillus toyonensis]EJV90008.1 hypothetical protein IGI_05522 [Bacillus toyonensis]EOP32149.1 hypothetical protein IG5_05595 [Bacillus toyonensis]MBE7138646.1 hypothetical protein [Bacillus toyonensis]MBE7166969.1 hypothetical protein [Bacillus toyonensis]
MNNVSKVLGVVLILSLAFNGILSYSTKKEFDKKDKKHHVTVAEKEKQIGDLKVKLEQESKKVNESVADENKKEDNPTLDLQNKYREVANQFVHAYLDYSVQNKGERRNNLLKITDKKVVDVVAPNTDDLGDPNFKSHVNKEAIYINSEGDISKKCTALLDVEYTIEGLENKKTTINSVVKITLEKQGEEIKVVEYNPYPAKR